MERVQIVYSEPRTRLLGFSLRAVQVLATVMGLLAAWVLVRAYDGETGGTSNTALLYAAALVLQAAVLFTVARWALRRLPGRSTDARLWCLIAGGLTLFSALPVVSTLVGIATVFVGLFLLTLALGKDRTP